MLSPLCSADFLRHPEYHALRGHHKQAIDPLAFLPNNLDEWFVTALVKAGSCKDHAAYSGTAESLRTKCTRQSISRLHASKTFKDRRHQHTQAFRSYPEETNSKEALLALVDQYDDTSLTEHIPLLENSAYDPQFKVSNEPQDSEWPSEKYTWPAQGEDQKMVDQLKKVLEARSKDTEHVYSLYRSLPAPRIPYLSASHRHMLLHTLAVMEHKDENAMLRYLSVVDDMKVCSIALNTAEWNNAMSFAGRYVARTTETEVEHILRLWKEMEHVAGVQSNGATFNILFDVATKAGKFKLGEMIYREMQSRGLAFNRYHYVSVIHFHGLRGDGDGVRKAYRDLVESGEIVDTVVLNCMISSLIRAGEPQAAEQVYARMKLLHEERSPQRLPSRDYEKRREVNKALVRIGELGKKFPAVRQKFQRLSIIAPDAQTYRILIHYLAVKAGDLTKTAALLEEMRWFEVPLQGSIFLSLFKGFAAHGGIRYSAWTGDRLESVWRAYIQAVEHDNGEVYLGKWIIIWTLKAFAQCSGETRAMQVWIEVKEKWKGTDEEMDHVTNTLRSLTEI